MHTTHIWHKLHLPGKKALILAVFCCLSLMSVAQHAYDVNNPNYDDRKIHYGFLISGHASTSRLRYSGNFVNNMDTLRSINPKPAGGFSLGLIVNYKLGEFFDARLLPAIAFYEYHNEYLINDLTVTKINSPVMAEFSFLVKYKSVRIHNNRFYIIGGIKPSIEVTPKNEEKTNKDLILDNTNISLEYGIGMDVYFPMFKFSPELRFSHGMHNMLSTPNDWSRGMSRLTTHAVSFYILFE